MVEDVSPTATWEALQADPNAFLVDVRTDAEWSFVGLPDLTEAGKSPVLIPWQVYPTMQLNPGFIDALKAAGATPDHSIYFLCRSGARSRAAAQAAVGSGFPRSYNIADGFEGPPDAEGHRGTVSGWKADGLPWRQR
jgi:rhodanese-related sulfurtransferase